MGGLGHDFKAGVNYINEPKLYVTFNSGSTRLRVHAPRQQHQRADQRRHPEQGRRRGEPADEAVRHVLPGRLAPDDRLTLNAGLRYDLVTGLRHRSVAASRTSTSCRPRASPGLFNGVVGFQEWGPSSREDYNNIQPRIGVAWDVFGNGRDLHPGRLGHLLRLRLHERQHPVPGPERAGRVGRDLHGDQHRRDQEPRRQLLRLRPADQQHLVAEPGEPGRAVLQQQRGRAPGPAAVHAASSRSAGRTSSTPSTVIDVDYVHVEGKDLGVRWPLNTHHAGRRAPLRVARLQPGQPDDEHEHRGEQVRRLQHRHAAPHGQQLAAQRLVPVVERPRPRRPRPRRVDDEPGAGRHRPAE